jgi:hypothetical protein
MVIKDESGKVIGEIALCMLPTKSYKPCPYPGPHGRLPYGFFRTGKRKPEVVVCDTHCHEGPGIYGGLLAKVKA